MDRTLEVMVLAIAALLGNPAHADIVLLVSGGSVEGKVVASDQDSITLQTKLGKVTLRREDVRSIEEKQFELPPRVSKEDRSREEYYEALGALDPSDARGLATLSAWCKEHDLADEAVETMEMALAIAPDDDVVRTTLGHFRSREGGWQTPEEHWAARGLVRYEGEWVSPAERARRIGQEASQQAHKKRRELSVRVRFELPRLCEAMETRDEGERERGAVALRERLARYAKEGATHLQGMPALDAQLARAVDLLRAGEYRDAREACIEVMEACDGVMRWEEAAAIALEVAGLRGALNSGKIDPTRRERAAMARIDDMRRRMGMPALAFSEGLYRASALHNVDMLALGYVDHTSPTAGRETADRRGHAQGVTGQIGENIYYGGLTADIAVRSWGNSPGHSANMFDSGWRRGGLAAVGRHWTHEFGE